MKRRKKFEGIPINFKLVNDSDFDALNIKQISHSFPHRKNRKFYCCSDYYSDWKYFKSWLTWLEAKSEDNAIKPEVAE